MLPKRRVQAEEGSPTVLPQSLVIPAEIWHEILGFFNPKDAGDLNALLQCALVSKTFTQSARPLIFKNLTMTTAKIGRLSSILNAHRPPFPSFVRKLSFVAIAERHTLSSVLPAVEALPHVHRLRLMNFCFDKGQSVAGLTFPNIKTLEIDGIGFSDFHRFISLLSAFPNLVSLSCTEVIFDVEPPTGATGWDVSHLPQSLSHLSLTPFRRFRVSDMTLLGFFIHTPIMSVLMTLHLSLHHASFLDPADRILRAQGSRLREVTVDLPKKLVQDRNGGVVHGLIARWADSVNSNWEHEGTNVPIGGSWMLSSAASATRKHHVRLLLARDEGGSDGSQAFDGC